MSLTLALPEQTGHTGDEDAPRIADRGHQPEVQGLRAIAVGLVLVYHFWPGGLTGGFIGVDVFFVISGFLISSHLYREAAGTGGVRVARFWARRIRRLLPISLLVLLVCLGASLAVLPRTVWAATFRQIAASALYTQNWVLAGDAVDYSARDSAATLVQHYWSLSVEEQFYLVWPLILLGAIGVSVWTRTRPAAGVRPGASRRPGVGPLPRRGYLAIIVSLVVTLVASLACSVVATHADSARSYFVTPTRVWEFAAGGLVGLVLLGRQLTSVRSSLLAWAGLATILGSALLFSGTTPFPGWVALFPVVGACILLGTTGGTSMAAPRWWLSRRPLTFLGDISYGIYLWHWPVLVLARYALGGEPGLVVKLLLAGLTIGLAAVSKRYVEDPWRHGPVIGTTRRALTFAMVAAALIAASALALTPRVDPGGAGAIAAREVKDPCFGPGALVAGSHCASVMGAGEPRPGPETVVAENAKAQYPGCQADTDGVTVLSCGLGATQGSADRTVALIGDSHAGQWFSAMDRLGKARNWHIKTYTKTACPATYAVRHNSLDWKGPQFSRQSGADCLAYTHAVLDRLVKDRSVSIVFATSRASMYSFVSSPDRPLAVPDVDGFAAAWNELVVAGKRVVVLGEVPRPGSQRVPDCLAAHPGLPMLCAQPATDAEVKHPILARAAAKLTARGVRYMPVNQYFCDRTLCYPVVGGLIAYRDSSHLSREYSAAMAPYIGSFLDQAGIT